MLRHSMRLRSPGVLLAATVSVAIVAILAFAPFIVAAVGGLRLAPVLVATTLTKLTTLT